LNLEAQHTSNEGLDLPSVEGMLNYHSRSYLLFESGNRGYELIIIFKDFKFSGINKN